MNCPLCVEKGLTSLIRTDPFIPKDKSEIKYWDDGDKLHVHDSSFRNRRLRCTNGHEMLTTEYDPCPSCDYNEGKTYLMVEDREKGTVVQYRFTKDKSWKRVITFSGE